jgi:hypothetical protein
MYSCSGTPFKCVKCLIIIFVTKYNVYTIVFIRSNAYRADHSGRAVKGTVFALSKPMEGMDVCVRLFCLCCSVCR